ncbi:MAG: hypothetical protein JWM47_3934 [Acidimicrobiales bacterium]|nr:hypothetical protein [Acidimicrobiales bacterium]
MRSRCPLAAWLLAAALAAGLGGCGLFDDEPRATSTTPVASTAPPRSGPSVLDAGSTPRTELRLRFTEGATTTVELTIDLDIDQQSGGRTQALHNPPVSETVRFTVDRVRGGEADVSFTFVEVSIDRKGSGVTDAEYLTLVAEVQPLIGLGGTGTLTDTGRFSGFTYDLPKGLDRDVAAVLEQARDQFATLAVPLPSVAVGVGARWEADTTATLSGVTVHQTTTYEITAIAGDVVTYEATTAQDARPQPLDPASLPSGTSVRLVSSELTGKTTGTLELTSVMADSRYRATGTQVIDLTVGPAAPQRLTQQITAAVAVRPAD